MKGVTVTVSMYESELDMEIILFMKLFIYNQDSS